MPCMRNSGRELLSAAVPRGNKQIFLNALSIPSCIDMQSCVNFQYKHLELSRKTRRRT